MIAALGQRRFFKQIQRFGYVAANPVAIRLEKTANFWGKSLNSFGGDQPFRVGAPGARRLGCHNWGE